MKYEVVKFVNDCLELEVNVSPKEETVWLSLNDLCLLFARDKSVISRHIKNILKENELDEKQVVAKNATTASDGKTYVITYYNLDVVIAVGYRVKSSNGAVFKKWAKETLDRLNNRQPESNIIVFNNNDISLDVTIRPNEDTVYLTKDQMSILFGRNRSVITRHIQNIFLEGELDEKRVCAKNARTGPDGKRYLIDYYNLDVIISVGYRVKSPNGVIFRKWALSVLKEYLLKGYVINDNRTLVTNENYINLINRVDSLDYRLEKLEKESVFFPKNVILFENQLFDAMTIIGDFVSRATKSIVLIDPYTDLLTLDVLCNKKENTSLTIITSDKTKITQNIIETFNHEYGGLLVKLNNDYHDRYLIIDDEVFYHLGSSINYLGKRFSQVDKITEKDFIELLRKRINEQK